MYKIEDINEAARDLSQKAAILDQNNQHLYHAMLSLRLKEALSGFFFEDLGWEKIPSDFFKDPE